MKIIIYGLITVFLLIGTFLGGVYYGFNQGYSNYYSLEKVLSANVDVLRAKDLKSGSEKDLKGLYWHFELSINDAIDAFNWYQDSGNHLLSKLFLSGHVEHLPKSIKNLAAYRKQNQLELADTESLLCELPDNKSDRNDCLLRIERRLQTVELYGNDS